MEEQDCYICVYEIRFMSFLKALPQPVIGQGSSYCYGLFGYRMRELNVACVQ